MRRRTEIQEKPKPRAKAKVRKEASVRQQELEADLTPWLKKESESKIIGKVRTIDTGELKNVIAQTVQRVYQDEFGMEVNAVNAREHHAQFIVMALKYGRWDEHGYLKVEGGIKMVDHDFGIPPLCQEHQVK